MLAKYVDTLSPKKKGVVINILEKYINTFNHVVP